MKDEELQWEIAKIMAWYCTGYTDWGEKPSGTKKIWFLRAQDIMDKIEESGYRKEG